MRVKEDIDHRQAVRAVEAAALAADVWAANEDVDSVVAALSERLADFDSYTAEHSQETVELAVQVARRLGASERAVGCVAQVAALHDVGKLGMPAGLLLKPGPLTNAERLVVEEHPVIGERILADIPELAELASAIRHEHERWDGRGYPDGLIGTEIPLASRIVLVCDAWHAMTSDRPYRSALDYAEAVTELRLHEGTQFDPLVTEALISVLGF